MKCSKCGVELKETDKFCSECGTKVQKQKQSSFSQKLDAQKKEDAHKEKMAAKEVERQNKIIQDKGLKNNDVFISFALGLIGSLLTVWPSGYDLQLEYWYVALTLGSGLLGYYFAIRANKTNKAYYQRYRVIVHPKLMKAGIYLSALATFGGVILLASVIIVAIGS